MRSVLITVLAALALVSASSCTRRARVVETDVQVPVTSGGTAPQSTGVAVVEAQPTPPPPQPTTVAASGQLLYIPAQAVAMVDQVAQIVIQANGQTYQLTRADLVAAAFGRVALRVPAGVTTGTITVYFTNGTQFSTGFQIAISGAAEMVGTVSGYADPHCHEIDGTWVGNITADSSAHATMQVEVLGDCRTIRGFMHLESGGGSVDSTIDGVWDVQNGMLTARDTQLFNQLGSFCATDEYVMHLEPDGRTFTGRNITRSAGCMNDDPVYMQHVGR